ncbi:transporter substrate-binding domain-containing protein [Terasakiella sp. SH-1]|uniref:substrate-binding periplasmic protein n=1 Tax=Terasakiella sp. SH-1 TaxID=2560057 RepID=UPI0010738E1B|nr:transporter substrate-binding domain-containing protein [Terasakiella sp. SH-1]
MPNLNAIIILMLYSILHIASAMAGNGKPQELVFGYEDIENPPHYLGTGQTIQQGTPGLVVELLQHVGKRLGTPVKFERMPWKRGLLNLQKNRLNGLFNASYKKKRTTFAQYPLRYDGGPDASRALMVQRYMLYIKRGKQKFNWNGNVLDFHSPLKKVGIKTGYSIATDLQKLGATVEEATNSEKNISKLIVERLIAYADLENMVDHYLARNPEKAQQVEKVEPPLRTKPYYLIFSQEFYRRYPDFAENFWDEIARFKQTDEYRSLQEKYLTTGSTQ